MKNNNVESLKQPEASSSDAFAELLKNGTNDCLDKR